MAKKNDRIDTQKGSSLAHNPFGALAGLAGALPKGPEAVAPEVAPAASTSPSGRIVLRRETKHRGGKTVVVASGFEHAKGIDEAGLAALASELKRTLGCGGTVEDGDTGRILVIQGDQPARVAELLRSKGFRVEGVTR